MEEDQVKFCPHCGDLAAYHVFIDEKECDRTAEQPSRDIASELTNRVEGDLGDYEKE